MQIIPYKWNCRLCDEFAVKNEFWYQNLTHSLSVAMWSHCINFWLGEFFSLFLLSLSLYLCVNVKCFFYQSGSFHCWRYYANAISDFTSLLNSNVCQKKKKKSSSQQHQMTIDSDTTTRNFIHKIIHNCQSLVGKIEFLFNFSLRICDSSPILYLKAQLSKGHWWSTSERQLDSIQQKKNAEVHLCDFVSYSAVKIPSSRSN